MRQPIAGDMLVLFSRVERFVCTPDGRKKKGEEATYQPLAPDVGGPVPWPSIPDGIGVWVLTFDLCGQWLWQPLVRLERTKET